MLQLSVAILNGPGKGCSSIMVPSTANSSFFVPNGRLSRRGKNWFDHLLDLRLKSASERIVGLTAAPPFL